MEADLIDTLERSLGRVNGRSVRTNTDELQATIREVIDEPAIGSPLPFGDDALPETVETEPTYADLEEARTGVTAAAFAIADYGSVVIRSSERGEEPISLYTDTHVAVVAESDVLPDMPTAFDRIGETIRGGDGDLVLATGPSATADMGALVQGAHGPKDVQVVVVTDQ
ncbi:LUD domain-containing protein [Natrialbaceae archaeon A-arb3/5]